MRFRSSLALGACVLATAALAADRVSSAPVAPRALTFDDRVRAQEAIERVYYRHQIGTTKPFEEAVPRSVIEGKVRRYLEQSAALEIYWKTPITDEALQRELDRMAGGTRMPERLQEIYLALGNDAFLVGECVARATLADRLAHNFYAFDPRFHTAARRAIDALRDQLASGALSAKADHPNRTVSEIAAGPEGEGAPGFSIDRRVSQTELERKRAQLPALGQASPVVESREAFYFEAVLNESPTSLRVATYVVPKTHWDAWWSSARTALRAETVVPVASNRIHLPAPIKGGTFDPNAPCTGDGWNNGVLDDLPEARRQHSAVWTGSVMLVWGGWKSLVYLDSGGRYDPVTDTWQPMTTVNAPLGRVDHTAVWTGSEMIVWGGYDFLGSRWFVSGGRYDPVTDRWTTISLGPSARRYHTAVWTGTRMIIWGGYFESGNQRTYLNTGELYDPSTDSWTPTATEGAPLGRHGHSAIWTGSEMIVWGGNVSSNGGTPTGDGGRYNPQTNAWSPMTATYGRVNHSAVWTGTTMIVWGGFQLVPCSYCGPGYTISPVNTGARYDPVRDLWIGMSVSSAPHAMNSQLAAWTGHFLMVIENDGSDDAGGLYDPSTDRWTGIASDESVPSTQGASLVWAGNVAVVWGGTAFREGVVTDVNSGRRYDPWNDVWTPTSTASPASQRSAHSAVWTGNEMLVWGGASSVPHSGFLDSGGRYDPGTDSWAEMTTLSAPSPRFGHTALWTGSDMLVWGGTGSFGRLNSGGRYDPHSDVWSSISEVDAPSPRAGHAAAWTGQRMVVWGGVGSQAFQDGGVYNPATDQWTATTLVDAPSVRQGHTAVWTGNRFVVWGGLSGLNEILGTGGRYDPETDTWSATSDVGAPSPRALHSAVWAGDRMVVWGGGLSSFSRLNTGGRYDPVNDTWSPTTTAGAPPGHAAHAAVAAGSRMLVWGGVTNNGAPNTGGLYDVASDRWTKITKPGEVMVSTPVTAVWSGEAMLVWTGISGGRYFPGHSLDDDCDADGVTGAAGDCDDHDSSTYPGAPARCDGVSNDCGSSLWPVPVAPSGPPGTPGETDRDRDGWLACAGDCDDNNVYVHPGAAEACDGWDTDCDGQNPALTEADNDHDGYRICQGDCDDTRSWVRPAGYEQCDGIDDDCDGQIDEGGDSLCVFNDGCAVGTCEGAAGCVNVNYVEVSCDDRNPCTEDDRCFDGTCRGSGVPDGTPCEDHRACTVGDHCALGYCYQGARRDCGNDGNDCNGVEYCDDTIGACAVFDVLGSCDDGNICTTDSCDPATGCSHAFNSDTCDDGNACTAGDVCTEGLCQPGETASCDDGNTCTDDACLPWAGCTHTNHDGACDDGNTCTGWDACENGACIGHDPVVCAAADACHEAGSCDPATGACSGVTKPDGTACDDGDLCTGGETCRSGTCTPAVSGLNEPNPRSTGYYKRLCIGPHSGDELTNADAACVATVASAFAGVSTVADLCAELLPSQPNNDACDKADDDLMVLALNICRARVCTQQGIDSHCGTNATVGQSLAESNAILSSPSRDADSCADSKCLDEEINTGRALEMNTLTLRREGGGVRLSWQVPYLDDGAGRPGKYHVWRRAGGSLGAFTKIGVSADTTYLDTGAGAFEYEVTAVMH